MACLDTTVFVDLRGRAGHIHTTRARALLRELVDEAEPIVTTRINLAELYVGIERSRDPVVERSLLQQMLDDIEILELDDSATRHFGVLKAFLLSIAGSLSATWMC